MEYSDKRAELIDWIAETVTDWNDNPRYTHEELEKMNGAKLFGIWLEWEGIVGYTGSIIETIEQACGGIQTAGDCCLSVTKEYLN